jgi:hypothetical protein
MTEAIPSPSAADVFCDYLSVTFSPRDFPGDDLAEFVLGVGGFPKPSTSAGRAAYKLGHGFAFIERRPNWCKAEATGSALAHLRALGVFMEWLSILGESPHSVSRLDVAVDVPGDYSHLRPHLHERHPGLRARLGRKLVGCTELTEARSDGEISGTFYIGQRGKTRSVARIYDKSWEAEKRRGGLIPSTIRYEVEVGRKFGATLRDASVPAPLFFHVAAPSLVHRPAGVPDWVASDGEGWKLARTEMTTYETLAKLVDRSPDLGAMLALSRQLGPTGPAALAALLVRRMDLTRRSDPTADKNPATSGPAVLAGLADSGAASGVH